VEQFFGASGCRQGVWLAGCWAVIRRAGKWDENVPGNRNWGLGYTKRGCWRRLGAGLSETRLFASFGGSITRNRVVGTVWGPVYAKQGCWRQLGAGLTRNEVV